MAETYTCEDCGGTFTKGRPDEEAHAEAMENFGVRGDAPGMAVVCDDCYHAIIMAHRRYVDDIIRPLMERFGGASVRD